jgi:hypothetical protein
MTAANQSPANPKFIVLDNTILGVNVTGWTPYDRDAILPCLDDQSNGGVGQNYTFAQNAISSYGSLQNGTSTPRFRDICLRGQINAGPNALILGFGYNSTNPSYPAPQRLVIGGTGYSLQLLFAEWGLSTSGITFATNPSLSLSGTLSQTSYYGADYLSYSFGGQTYFANGGEPSPAPTQDLPSGIVVKNSDWQSASTATDLSGNSLVSALGPRSFLNSPKYFTELNYLTAPPQAPTSLEPGMTVDLDPGSYSIAISDATVTTPSLPGLMTHVRITPGDLISPNRIVDLWAQGYVATGSNLLILGFHIDQPKAVMIIGAGPGLGNLGYIGTLGQPVLTVYNSAGAVMATGSTPSQKIKNHYGSLISSGDVGVEIWSPPLPAGTYTVVLSGYNSGVGLGLIDICEDPYPGSSYY